MKKLNIVYILLGISLVVILIISIVAKVPKTVQVTTFKKSYSYVSKYQENEEIIINVYINQLDSYITQGENIESSYITDNNNEDHIILNLKKVNNCQEKISLNKDEFHLFQYIFDIEFLTDSDFSLEIDNAYLCLEYAQDDFIKIGIGSFSFYKVEGFGSEDLSIARLKGVVNTVNNVKTLVGIAINFKNNNTIDLTITNIIPLVLKVETSNNDVKKLNSFNYNSGDTIKSILGYEFNPYQSNSSDIDLNLQINDLEDDYYIFPLKHQNIYPVNKVGFIVEYEIDNIKKKMYFDDFTFFTSSKYSKNEINKLIYYTYENY